MAQGQAVVDERVEMSAHGVDVLAEGRGDRLGTDRAGLGLQELQDPGAAPATARAGRRRAGRDEGHDFPQETV